MKKFNLLLFFVLILLFIPNVYAATNPYGKYQELYNVKTVRCTWYAWQQAYENAGVALPGWDNAQTWYNSAKQAGYSVGREARANSIAVWSSIDGYGHVGYVVSVDGEYMTTNEGGMVTEENEGIIKGIQRSVTAENLIGFIYLDDAPKTPASSNNASSNNTNTQTNVDNVVSSEAEKSSNNYLSDLTVDVENFIFDKNTVEYTLVVDNDIQIITINAIAEDENAQVTGTGQKALKIGENKYVITVIAEDGTERKYSLIVTREEVINNTIENEVVEETKGKNLYIYIIIGFIFIGLIATFILKNKKLRK